MARRRMIGGGRFGMSQGGYCTGARSIASKREIVWIF